MVKTDVMVGCKIKTGCKCKLRCQKGSVLYSEWFDEMPFLKKSLMGENYVQFINHMLIALLKVKGTM